MRRRLVIARALLNNPQILFLDEPTTALDPHARLWIWEAIENLKQEGLTVVLTTHYMEEAERLCDRVGIMDKGKFLAEGGPRTLIEDIIGNEVVEFRAETEDLEYHIQRLKGQFPYQVLNNKVRLFLREGQDARQVFELISSDSIQARRATLEDVFLKLAGHELS
jgi:lipooligosaccharide transport system ATP-binding protein